MLQCSLPFFNGYLHVSIRDDVIIGSELASHPLSAGLPSDPLVEEIRRQVAEYLMHKRETFDLPFAYKGTDFQGRVWQYLLGLSAGQTVSYGHAAMELRTSARAVGGACKNNPLAVFVPCHRIVAQNGIGGYAGDWQQGRAISQKQKLLEHERHWCREIA